TNDPKQVERLATPEAAERLGPETVLFLANYLSTKSVDRAIGLLRVVQERFPGDFWLNITLANALERKSWRELADYRLWEEVGRCLAAALALRPDDPGLQGRLGHALVQGASLTLAWLSCDEPSPANLTTQGATLSSP